MYFLRSKEWTILGALSMQFALLTLDIQMPAQKLDETDILQKLKKVSEIVSNGGDEIS